MLVSLLIGLGVGMVLRQFVVEEPAIDMAIASQNHVGRAMGRNTGGPPGSMGAPPHNAPGWLRGFAYQQRQPLSSFAVQASSFDDISSKFYDMVSGKVVDATVDRPGYERSWSLHAHLAPSSAESDAIQRLQSALQEAEECVGQCALEWDNVEKLSTDVDPRQWNQVIKDTKEKLATARKKMVKDAASAKEVDEKLVMDIASAHLGMKEIAKNVPEELMARLDAALQTASEVAKLCTGAECFETQQTIPTSLREPSRRDRPLLPWTDIGW